MRSSLLYLLLLLCFPGQSSTASSGNPPRTLEAHAPEASSRPESRKRLLSKLKRWSKLGPQSDLLALESIESVLRELDREWTGEGIGQDDIFLGLLDFLGRCVLIADAPGGIGLGPEPISLGGTTEQDLRIQVSEILRRRIPEWGERITLSILMGRVKGKPHPVGRRIGACEVLETDDRESTTLALLSTTRPIPPETHVPRTLLDAAVKALSKRRNEGVHLRLLDLLERGENKLENLWIGAIEAHFASIRLDMGQKRPVAALAHFVGAATSQHDWRRASRGVQLSQGLPDELAFPLLIGALETWMEEVSPAIPSARRIRGEIASQLQMRSGRNLGAHPLRWRSLWEGYLRGEVRWYGESAMGGLPTTVGGFFGLRPETDSLVFLLDRSGSMQASFGKERSQSRLEEAVDQMAGLMAQLGPDTSFNLITFSDTTQSWKRKLAPATEKNIRAARQWALQAGASGGTNLRSGVQRVLHVGTDGRVDLEKLSADTVIVLCDGGTSAGPTWVAPFLKRINDDARIVFHAVQLGAGGDGTLEALAAKTGGDFQLVDG
jgi:hypothetical protein